MGKVIQQRLDTVAPPKCLGEPGSSQCPMNCVPIERQLACEYVADSLGVPFSGTRSNPLQPGGCVLRNYSSASASVDNLFFNIHPSGSSSRTIFSLVCTQV